MSALSTTVSNTFTSTASPSMGNSPAAPSKKLGTGGEGVVSMSGNSTMGLSKAPQPRATPAAGAHGCFFHRDVKCGTLLCLSDNTSPVLGGGSYSLFFGRFKCKAVIASSDANEVVAKLRLVPTGAKCGEEMVSVLAAVLGWWWEVTTGHGDLGQPQSPPACPQVCYAGRCQNLLVYGNKNCSAKCNNHGVCCGIVLSQGSRRARVVVLAPTVCPPH